ncbi:alpha-amylase [Podospora conica]|nr:alpha-amylase [Schizothecium conicum]
MDPPKRTTLSHLTLPNPYHPPSPPPLNTTLFQAFEWYLPAPPSPTSPSHWTLLAALLPSLSALGVSRAWIPPACKAASPHTNGYDIYDLYDLGEFDQKGSVRTKWGTKAELEALVRRGEEVGVAVLFDAVLGHKAAADEREAVRAVEVDPRDRRVGVKGEGGEVVEVIEAWTRYRFDGRGDRYSAMRWGSEHFTGIDWDDAARRKGVWRFEGKRWAEDVDEELGNYDYLMFADVDHKHPQVRYDLFYWVQWLRGQMKLGGLRLDAIKHYSASFLRDLLEHIDERVDSNWFLVGEYWREDSEFLAGFIEYMNHRMSLFDVQLVANFSRISLLEEKGDLREIFDDALVLWKPDNAVTFVVNHDTQKGQSLETPVAPFFIPLAYALILLRANAGLPCVFWSDLYGSFGQHPDPQHTTYIPPCRGGAAVPKMMLARQRWAYGAQYDYFDAARCVGFTRLGHPAWGGGAGLAVLMTNGWEGATKRMFVGREHAGEVWTDLLRWCPGRVVVDGEGFGEFMVAGRSVSVWVSERAQGRREVDEFVL